MATTTLSQDDHVEESPAPSSFPTDAREAAKLYLDRGWRVGPVQPKSKEFKARGKRAQAPIPRPPPPGP